VSLRPKRAACGVAGLRSGSGQGQAQKSNPPLEGVLSRKAMFRPTDTSELAKRWFKSHPIGFPPIKQPLALEAEAFASGCPRKMGQKKETFSCPTYMLSGIAFGVVAHQ
jgi:hypothetical protein